MSPYVGDGYAYSHAHQFVCGQENFFPDSLTKEERDALNNLRLFYGENLQTFIHEDGMTLSDVIFTLVAYLASYFNNYFHNKRDPNNIRDAILNVRGNHMFSQGKNQDILSDLATIFHSPIVGQEDIWTRRIDK